MKKRNDLPVCRFGGLPSEVVEKKLHPHKEKDVPGVGAMGCLRNLSATRWA